MSPSNRYLAPRPEPGSEAALALAARAAGKGGGGGGSGGYKDNTHAVPRGKDGQSKGAKERRKGDWECGKCGANVFANKSKCFKCRTHRPPPAVHQQVGGEVAEVLAEVVKPQQQQQQGEETGQHEDKKQKVEDPKE